VGALKEAEAGVSVKELCRRIGISDATFYPWKANYGGLVPKFKFHIAEHVPPPLVILRSLLVPIWKDNDRSMEQSPCLLSPES
jgi:hypothetical protein